MKSRLKKIEIPDCMFPGCQRASYIRGLCGVCYRRLNQKVLKGKDTWENLIEKGLVKPSKK